MKNADQPELVAVLKVDARGRVTLPKRMREQLDWSEGDRLQFEPTGNGAYYIQNLDEPERAK